MGDLRAASLVLVALAAASCGKATLVPSSLDVADASVKEARGGSAETSVAVEESNLAWPEAPPVEVPEDPPKCEDVRDLVLFASPRAPSVGTILHVVAVSDKPLAGELVLSASSKAKDAPPKIIASSDARRGGPPYHYWVDVPAPRAGTYTLTFTQKACEAGENVASRKIFVRQTRAEAPPPPTEEEGLWPIRSAWSHRLENVYSAWIERLFDAPDEASPSWSALQELLRDPARNGLYEYLSVGEDSTEAPVIRPDCADLPYFLRAYFSYKLGLPFGVSECNRGGGGLPPSCKNFATIDAPVPKFDPESTALKNFAGYLRGALADRAHSGSGRTTFDDEASDYYPVPLTWDSLRPGTVYADPYGHVLVVAKRLPQTASRGGVLLAVDGQPDGTVARKRFWRGNFLYAHSRDLGGPGFKRFRPIVKKDGAYVKLDDAAIAARADYRDGSRAPGDLDIEPFYDAMDDLLSPRPLDPRHAMMQTIDALDEQVKARVRSVENGRKWLAQATEPALMPEGAQIFETTGEWEDFATPSRDLRLLLAMDVVRGYPERVARRMDRYAVPDGMSAAMVRKALEKLLHDELRSRTVTYARSDESPFTLTLADVLARREQLELAYNLNDCVEVRWGAPPSTEEMKTCLRRAPDEQRVRMEEVRSWFRERRRPPRN